ncbi:hypothetical protein [Neoroseomonas rubea]|uniref:hypothetical protein n=1 Tax=Neoroseomonas rubea TaxID=2748666 RepID=UPI0018DF9187|nr:hypothetical protein [Roseomonas rubea]
MAMVETGRQAAADRRRVPLWVSALVGLVAAIAGAAIGGAIASTWTGALIGMAAILPLALLFVLQAVSCAS